MDSNDSISTRPDGETWKCYSPNSGPLASYKADAGTGPPLVTISLEDGSVTFGPDYNPDEAARMFWDAVRMYFPGKLAP
jgi:hypothetical protein